MSDAIFREGDSVPDNSTSAGGTREPLKDSVSSPCDDLAVQRTASEITDAQLELVRTLAQQATLALQMTTLAEDAQAAALARAKERAALEHSEELAHANLAIRRAIDSLVRKPDLREFLRHVLEEVLLQAGGRSGAVFQHDAQTDTLRRMEIIHEGKLPAFVDRLGQSFPAAESPSWIRLSRDHRPSSLTVDEARDSWPAFREWALRERVRAFLAIPMELSDQLIGFFGVAISTETPELTTGRLELINTLAQQATLAIELTRLGEEAKDAALTRAQKQATSEHAAEMAKANDVLLSTLDRLASEEAPDAFLAHLLSEIAGLAGADTGYLFLYDVDDAVLVLHSSVRDGVLVRGPLPDDPEIFRSPIPREITDLYLSATRKFTWRPIDEGFRWRSPDTLAWHRRMGHRATAAVALYAGRHPVGVLGLAFRDGTPLARAKAEVIQTFAAQAALALELTRLGNAERAAAVADERNVIAREIHDTLAQGLALIVMQLADAETKLGSGWSVAEKPLETVRELAVEGLAFARRSVGLLRPTAVLGLPRALRALVGDVARHFPGRVDMRIDDTPFTLDAPIETELLGIAREALNNASRHSRATHLRVELAFIENRAVRLVIADDGTGFDPNRTRPDAYGLVGMHERAARIGAALTFVTERGAGTEIVAAWPA